MSNTIITTSHKTDDISLSNALEAASIIGTEFVARNRRSLDAIREEYNCQNIIVVKDDNYVLHSPNGEYSFHPNMSVPRIKAIREGKSDHMLKAMELREGDRVLDCTLGLGSDAIVASFAVGAEGKVVGLEAEPELAFLVRTGLAQGREERRKVREAMSRIEVVSSNYLDYLRQSPDKSFDIVYFDPMFRFPRKKSSAMEPLRTVVNHEPLSQEAIVEATRVAKRKVVLKENWFSKEFQRLGFERFEGGKYSPIVFGIIDIQEDS